IVGVLWVNDCMFINVSLRTSFRHPLPHTQKHTHIQMHTKTHMHTPDRHTHSHKHWPHTHTHTHTHLWRTLKQMYTLKELAPPLCLHTHTHIHTLTHTHTHTHTQR